MKIPLLYCHLLIHAEIYIYMLDTYRRNELIRRKDNDRDTGINDAGRLLYKDIYLSLYCKGFAVRGSWRPNINCNILTPLL